MNIVGLITEYNPFHNGHLYHINEAKKVTNADYVIVVMSGNFVQRGTPAFIDKYQRTKMALLNGADLVIELPVCYATSSAETFALGAVAILNNLSIVNSICFGSECGDISILSNIAKIMLTEPEPYQSFLQSYLKSGYTFPAARMHALLEYDKMSPSFISNTSSDITHEELKSLLASSNNILGIEYMKALFQLNSNIKPYTIKRKDSNYNDEHLTDNISSATAIRKSIQRNETIRHLKNNVPSNVYTILEEQYKKTHPIFEDDFSLLLSYQLMRETDTSLLKYLDITKGLNMRIDSYKNQFFSYSDFAMELKTKQYTLTRINRALLHLLLNIKKENLDVYKENGYALYARILGFKKSSSHLIKKAKERSEIPFITKMADAKLQLSEIGLQMLEEDVFAANLYNLVVYQKFDRTIKNEYVHPLVIL